MKIPQIILSTSLICFLTGCITYPKNDFPTYNPAKIEKKIKSIDFVVSYKPYNALGTPFKINQATHLATRQVYTQIISNCHCINNFNVYVEGLDDLSDLKNKNLVRIEITTKPYLNTKFITSTILFAVTAFLFPSIDDIYAKTEFIAYSQGKEIKRYTYENEIVEIRGLLLIFVRPFTENNYITNLNVTENFLNEIYRDKLYPFDLK